MPPAYQDSRTFTQCSYSYRSNLGVECLRHGNIDMDSRSRRSNRRSRLKDDPALTVASCVNGPLKTCWLSNCTSVAERVTEKHRVQELILAWIWMAGMLCPFFFSSPPLTRNGGRTGRAAMPFCVPQCLEELCSCCPAAITHSQEII